MKLNYRGSICTLTFINPYACVLGSVLTECANVITDGEMNFNGSRKAGILVFT